MQDNVKSVLTSVTVFVIIYFTSLMIGVRSCEMRFLGNSNRYWLLAKSLSCFTFAYRSDNKFHTSYFRRFIFGFLAS